MGKIKVTQCGDDFYDGKDADLEYNLLHKIIVFDQGIGSTV